MPNSFRLRILSGLSLGLVASLWAAPSLAQLPSLDLDDLLPDPMQSFSPDSRERARVGSLSSNRYLPGSTSAPGAQYQPSSPSNRYGTYGSRYSPDGARNPYTTGGLDIVGSDGTYLGKLNSNRYDPNSVSNSYGRYGSRYSPESINNPYGRYGSRYSPSSARNPYATQPPGLYEP